MHFKTILVTALMKNSRSHLGVSVSPNKYDKTSEYRGGHRMPSMGKINQMSINETNVRKTKYLENCITVRGLVI
jgi:hypothetical protein